jgi:alkanesulfonate monooxygenase SsuD/methylene tetrahydromethanopterin reductase-like flavin-dependent oxidoreductase (luciferase family)
MEFGFLTQGYVPNDMRRADPDAEHTVLMDDFDLCLAADAAGFKYIWISEHHFLDEYSHISANDVFIGALARTTTRAHLGSGIYNPLPKVNHPAKVAERVAMLDHLTEGRFEFGTGRGAGSHEVTGFHDELIGTDVSETKEIWKETITEFPKMWLQEEYEGFSGKYWSMPPRKVLPKPWKKPHPPLWYAAGNTSSFDMAGRMGLGVLGFSLDHLDVTEKAVATYKKAVADAEPVGAYVNDNLLVAGGVTFLREDRDDAWSDARGAKVNYHISQVFRYHDTFPRPEGIPQWPEVLPEYTDEVFDAMIDAGAAIIGDPDDALTQFRRWEAAGADQILLLRGTKTREQTLEMIRLMGEHVIPKIDTDPVHRTSRFRDAAARREAAR